MLFIIFNSLSVAKEFFSISGLLYTYFSFFVGFFHSKLLFISKNYLFTKLQDFFRSSKVSAQFNWTLVTKKNLIEVATLRHSEDAGKNNCLMSGLIATFLLLSVSLPNKRYKYLNLKKYHHCEMFFVGSEHKHGVKTSIWFCCSCVWSVNQFEYAFLRLCFCTCICECVLYITIIISYNKTRLTHFGSMFHFYTFWKRQKTNFFFWQFQGINKGTLR